MELKFTGQPGTGSLAWDVQTPGNCEYTDINGNTISSSWVNGTITMNQPPVKTSDPVNKTIYAGGSTTFTVTATGAGLTYLWQVSQNNGTTWSGLTNGSPYTGTTTATLTINPATVTMNGNLYRCYISGTCLPPVYSASASLTVTQAAITTTIPNVSNSCTGNLVIPVNVASCLNVGSISLALIFDPAKMTYDGYQAVNSQLSSGILSINQSSNKIYMSWASTTAANIVSGALFNLRFKTSAGISTALTWDTLTPGNCEYSNINGTIITSFYNNVLSR